MIGKNLCNQVVLQNYPLKTNIHVCPETMAPNSAALERDNTHPTRSYILYNICVSVCKYLFSFISFFFFFFPVQDIVVDAALYLYQDDLRQVQAQKQMGSLILILGQWGNNDWTCWLLTRGMSAKLKLQLLAHGEVPLFYASPLLSDFRIIMESFQTLYRQPCFS